MLIYIQKGAKKYERSKLKYVRITSETGEAWCC